VTRLRAALDRRTIRASVVGRIGEAPTLAPGAFLEEGALVATVVPDGELRVIGVFAPSEALGRVRVGQRARLRLDGFPWTWFGTVPATVQAVADEVRDGGVRVELAPEPAPTSPIPLQHGLPGAVEIAVEEISPAALVLRSAGQLLAPSRTDR
ncbi:MAG: HlyD family efflux transporter periplasmic adaptor subunit, partial [Myxococcota bacterium]